MPYDRSIVQNWIFESNKEGTVDIMFSFSSKFADFVIVFVVLIVIGCICANDQTEV